MKITTLTQQMNKAEKLYFKFIYYSCNLNCDQKTQKVFPHLHTLTEMMFQTKECVTIFYKSSWGLSTHYLEIRGLRQIKCSCKTLQNLLWFMYFLIPSYFFILSNIIFLKLYEIRDENTALVFLCKNYSKFWSVLLEHFRWA